MARSRRGGFVIIVAVSLTALAGLVALSFDIGYARVMRARLEMALEAATHAAGKELDGTDDGVDNALSAALSMSERYTVAGETLAIASDDVEFGTWDDATSDFVAESDAAAINAVRINTSVNVPLMFGAIAFADSDLADGFNLSGTTVATSGATDGASATNCVLPLAVPSCAVDSNGDGVLNSTLHDSKFDTGGCAGLFGTGYTQAFMATAGALSAAKVRDNISDCEAMGGVAMGDLIGTDVILRVDNTGMNSPTTNNTFTVLNSMISASSDTFGGRWSINPAQMSASAITVSKYGHTLEGPVMVVDVPNSWCTAATSSSTMSMPTSGTVIGFVWGVVYDARKRCTKDDGTTLSSGASGCPSTTISSCSSSSPTALPSYKEYPRIRFRIDTTAYETVGSVGGGEDWGVYAPGSVRIINNPE